MSEETAEELTKNYSRAELDKMTGTLDLDSANYPNKRSIAEAIITVREEQRERKRIEKERMERAALIQELKKKMKQNTVKGKIAASQVFNDKFNTTVNTQMSENQKATAAIQTGINEQINENKEAVANTQSGVKDLAKTNRGYAKNFQSLVGKQVGENQKAVAAMQTGIKEQMSENSKAVKTFYG